MQFARISYHRLEQVLLSIMTLYRYIDSGIYTIFPLKHAFWLSKLLSNLYRPQRGCGFKLLSISSQKKAAEVVIVNCLVGLTNVNCF